VASCNRSAEARRPATVGCPMLGVNAPHGAPDRRRRPDSAYVTGYDAARFALVGVLAQQGLRSTQKGGHLAVEHAIRAQFGDAWGTVSTNWGWVLAEFVVGYRQRHGGGPARSQVVANTDLLSLVGLPQPPAGRDRRGRCGPRSASA
jgi:hypothetical protein